MARQTSIGPFLWGLTAAGSVFWLLWTNDFKPHFLWLTLGRMSEHWFLTGLAALLILIASGKFGADLGIPQLFHDEPGTPLRRSRVFWSAFGATLLFAEIGSIIGTVEFLKPESYLSSSPDVSDAAWSGFPADSPDWGRYSVVRHLKMVAVTGVPLLAFFALASAMPAPIPCAPKRTTRLVTAEVMRVILGIFAGITLHLACAALDYWIFKLAMATNHSLLDWFFLRAHRIQDMRSLKAADAMLLIFLGHMLLVGAVFLTLGRRVILPGLGIAMLLWTLAGLNLALVSIVAAYQPVLLIILTILMVVGNNGAYKYRFPGMGEKDGRSVYEKGNRLVLEKVLRGVVATGARVGLADDRKALQAWHDRVRGRNNCNKPKLIVLTITGGAYRSAYWAATVLDEFARRSGSGGQLEGFLDHIRLITGASGGMVGAAYFVALCADGTRPDGRNVCTMETLRDETRRDSLTPIVRQLISRDLPLVFVPVRHQREDRGTVLDEQWKLLRRPVSALADSEARGDLPSLVISPMVVETGRRMLISNLELSHISITRPELGDMSPVSAVEFFKYFPESRATFSLQTAVRMSATFPYASPAVSLPTEPPRRLVDAGYYDNYGVNLAASWAYHHRDWIAANTTGLALIQLNAYATRDAKRNTLVIGRPACPSAALFDYIRRTFAGLTAPAEGAFSAREWTMSFRNDEQIRVLHDYFNSYYLGMFASFEFENPADFAMNWFLSEDDIEEMRDCITTDGNAQELDRLSTWWNSSGNENTGRHQARGSAP
jgi:hypothetical protein